MKWLRRKTKSDDAPLPEKTHPATDSSSGAGNCGASENPSVNAPPKASSDAAHQVHEITSTNCPEGETSADAAQTDLKKTASLDLDPSVYPKGFRLAVIVASLCFSIFLVALDQTIIATAIPRITNQFHSLEDVGWYASAYLLTSTSLQPTYGKVYQNFSLKWVFIGVVSVFEIGSLICGVAPSSTVFIVGRAIAGLGAGGIFAGALTIIAYSIPLRKRPMFAGAMGAMFGIASVAGPLLGGVFTDHLTWRWCFFINLPIGGITIIGITAFFKNPDQLGNDKSLKERLKQLDFYGAAFLIPAVVCLLLALQWGGTQYPWNDAKIIGLFCAFGAIIIIFIVIQILQGENATIPSRVFFQRSIFFSSIFSFFVGSSFLIVVFYIPLYFQGVKGVSATHSGIMTLPLLISVVVFAMSGGVFVTVVGYYTPSMICGMAIFTIGIGLLSTLSSNTPFGKWFGYQVLAGAGIGSCLQLPMIAVQASVSRQLDIPIATALVIFFQQLGGALFISVGQAIFQNKLIPQMQQIDPSLTPQQIVSAGATGLKQLIPDQLPAVLTAYAKSLNATFEVGIAMAGMGAIVACFIEFRSIKGKAVGPMAGA